MLVTILKGRLGGINMFESLANFWNANQDRLEQEGLSPGQMNTAGIAGQLMASGVPAKDAYVQAAKIFRDQEKTNLERNKQENKQQQLATASQILQQGGGLADLLAAGVDHPAILGALPQSQWVPNKGHPEGGEYKTPPVRGMQGMGGGGMQQPQNNMTMDNQSLNMAPPQQNREPRYDEFDTSELGKKAELAVKTRRIQEADEYVRKTNDQARNARATVHTADQLEAIIPHLFSGKGLDPETKERWANALGINPDEVNASQIFTGEVSNIIGEIERQVKDGRSTDAAAQIIIDAKPKKGNTEEANLSLIRGIKARGIALDEKAEALTKWADAGRDPNKFEQTWAAYERKNPYLSLDKKGHVKVNESNISKWRKVIFGEEIGEVNDAHRAAEEPTQSNNNADQKLLNKNFERLKSILAQ
jgi:hypothetical protein